MLTCLSWLARGRVWGISLALAGCSPHRGTNPPKVVPRPSAPAANDEAVGYMLTLINRDRGAAGLSAVELDPVASIGAERHARDMAAHGFTAHWGSDGSVPEQR